MGVSRKIELDIDRLVLRGIDPAQRRVLVEAIRSELERILANPGMGAALARSRQTPVLRFTNLRFEPGAAGARNLGANVGRAIGRGLKK